MKRKRKNIAIKKSNSRRQSATRARPESRDLGPSRDFQGYGAHPPHARWPGDARIAVNLNLNVEAGGERCILEGDTASEHILTDIGFAPYENARSPIVESVFEYGPRVGCWRLLRIFRQFDIKVSILGVVRGLQQYPELVDAFVEEGHEIVSHGWRWLDYHHMSEQEEREHIHLAFEGIKALTGAAPVGWFNGRPSINTRRLVIEHGDFLYDRDYLGDELPFWVSHDGRHHLVIPFSFETNDNRFDQNNGFSTADDFATYLNDCFDLLYEEGAETPKIMTVSLHDRLIGRPAKAVGLMKFLDHARKHDRVWFCTGKDIALHWYQTHPPKIRRLHAVKSCNIPLFVTSPKSSPSLASHSFMRASDEALRIYKVGWRRDVVEEISAEDLPLFDRIAEVDTNVRSRLRLELGREPMQWIAGLAFQPRSRIALLREFLQLLKVKAPPALRTDPVTRKQSIIGPAPKRNLANAQERGGLIERQ